MITAVMAQPQQEGAREQCWSAWFWLPGRFHYVVSQDADDIRPLLSRPGDKANLSHIERKRESEKIKRKRNMYQMETIQKNRKKP